MLATNVILLCHPVDAHKPWVHSNIGWPEYYCYYASVGGAPRHTVVVVFVCVILQRAFLGNRNELSNESCNATTAQHSTTAKLARFLL